MSRLDRFATAAFLGAFLIVPTMAAAETDGANAASDSSLYLGGTAGLELGFLHLEGDEIDIPEASNGIMRGRGAVSIPFQEKYSAQLDAIGEYGLNQSEDNDKTTGNLTFAGHLSRRDPSSHLFGLFTGGGLTFDDGDDSNELPFYFAGGEGQVYWNQSTFQGQIGFLGGEDIYRETIRRSGFGRIVASHYYSENGKVSAEVGYLRGYRAHGDSCTHRRGLGSPS